MEHQQKLITNKPTEVQDNNESVFFSLIQRVGAMGPYQIITFILWCLLSYLTGGLLLITPFLFYQDPYDCQNDFPGASCLDYVCSLNPTDRQAFVPLPSISSLATKFGDYRCPAQQSQMNSIIALMYGGALCGIILLSFLGDLVGRKKLMLINMYIAVAGLLVTIFSVDMLMAGIGLFLSVFGIKVSHNLSYIFVAQTVLQKYRQQFSITIAICFGVGSLLNVLWFFLIGNFETILIFCYGLPTLLITGAIFFFVKETPICILTKLSARRAHKHLEYIARANRKGSSDMTVEDIEEIQQNYRQSLTNNHKEANQKQNPSNFNVMDLFRFKSLRKLTLLLMFLDFAVALQYYTPTLMLDQFKFSIFINGLVVQSSQLLAGILTFFIIRQLKRRALACVSFAVILASATALTFIWNQNQQEVDDVGSNIIVLVFVFILEFAITVEFNFFMVYINELFPTQVRIIGIGFIEIFGTMVLVTSKSIITFCLTYGIKIMAVFAVLAAFCAVASYLLPETRGKMPAETIEQLSAESSTDKDEQTDTSYGIQNEVEAP